MPMKRRLSRMIFAGMIASVLASASLLLTVQIRAQPADARCTGETDVPWSEQIAACTRLIESARFSGKDLAKVLIFRGKAYGHTGDIDRCLVDIEEAIRLDPANAVAVGGRGDVYLVRKDYERALAAYTKAASLDPNNALVLIGRGMAYLGKGDVDRAMADFEQAIRLQPASTAGLYWRGIAKCLKGDVAAGEADIAAAKKIDPKVDQ
jgi:tetratricopeptide (TPR) repeat protein